MVSGRLIRVFSGFDTFVQDFCIKKLEKDMDKKQNSEFTVTASMGNEETVKKLIQFEMKKQVRETMEDILKNRKRNEVELGEELYSLSEGN